MTARLPRGLAGALTAGLAACAAACTAVPTAHEPGPSLEVEAASRTALAERTVRALIDTPAVAERCPRAGPGDPRLVVRFPEADARAPQDERAWEDALRTALLGSGRFLLVEGPGADAAGQIRLSPAAGDELVVALLGPGDAVLARVRGAVRPPK